MGSDPKYFIFLLLIIGILFIAGCVSQQDNQLQPLDQKSQKDKVAESNQSKDEKRCGDNFCNEIERATGGCPQDCGQLIQNHPNFIENTTTPSESITEQNPTTSKVPRLTAKYLLAFHTCDTSTTNCNDFRNHQTYIAQSNDGVSWLPISNYTPYFASVPDLIVKGNTLYVYSPGRVRKYRVDSDKWEEPIPVIIKHANGSAEDFVDPSPTLDDGNVVLFYLVAQKKGDPASCKQEETSCTKIFRSATEVQGSDGTEFLVDSGNRAEIAIKSRDTASDPDIFQGPDNYVLYVSRGPSVQALSSPTLRGQYTNIPGLPDGILVNRSGGIPAGYYDNATSNFWTYVHIPKGNIQVIKRAISKSLNAPIQESEFSTILTGSNFPGLGNSYTVASPGFTLNPFYTKEETFVLQGYAVGKNLANEQATNVMMPEVVKLDNGKYRMYYGWAGGIGPTTGIKSAISDDGKKWTVEDGFRLQGSKDKNDREALISGPSIVKLPDGRYRMYYQSSQQVSRMEPPKFHVRSAISPDGLNFTREGVRIEIAPYSTETGLKLAGHGKYFIASNGTYVGIFSGNSDTASRPSSLIITTSEDGLKWGNFKELYGNWHDPTVLKTEKGYVLYATYLLEKQGMAISNDGLNWSSEMTSVTFQDKDGNKLTEGNSGVGDLGGVIMPNGQIIIYANLGQPSENIVYFTKS